MRAIIVCGLTGLALVLAATSTAAANKTTNTPSILYSSARYYGDSVHFTLHYTVGFDNRCESDGYGGWSPITCYDVLANTADLDVIVYRTAPTWRKVYADSIYGLAGLATEDVSGSFDLGLDCYRHRHGYVESFKAVFHLYSPIDDRVLYTTTARFRDTC